MKGDTGATGPQGSKGPEGPQGPAGPQGPQGPAGSNGTNGGDGPQGDTGATGPAGPQGPQGPAGFDGDVGPQGVQGAQGAQGPQGPAGPAGAPGATGPQGPQGPQGEPGITNYDAKLNIESDRNYSDDELAFVFEYRPSSTEPAEESYVYLDGMSNVKSNHDLVLKFRDKLETRLSNYSSGYTRQSFSYDNFEFYLEFSLGYVGTKILSGISFTSAEANAPTTALSKMRDEFTVTSGSQLFYTTGNNFYIQFTLEPKVRGLEDVYSIGSAGTNVGFGTYAPKAKFHVGGNILASSTTATNAIPTSNSGSSAVFPATTRLGLEIESVRMERTIGDSRLARPTTDIRIFRI